LAGRDIDFLLAICPAGCILFWRKDVPNQPNEATGALDRRSLVFLIYREVAEKLTKINSLVLGKKKTKRLS
jgi:hypothetical protein